MQNDSEKTVYDFWELYSIARRQHNDNIITVNGKIFDKSAFSNLSHCPEEKNGKRIIKKVNFDYCDLGDLCINDICFIYCSFRTCDLSHISFNACDFIGGSFANTDLHSSYFNSNLSNVSFGFCDMEDCTLSFSSNIENGYLTHCDLSNTRIAGQFTNCSFYSCNFFKAELGNSTFKKCNFGYNNQYYFSKCPTEGSFIGYKKAHSMVDERECIIKLKITENALRSSATSNKCRCSRAKVLSIKDLYTNENILKAHSSFDESFIYEVGKTVVSNSFNENRWEECSNGIHFFMTEEEAKMYSF